MTVVPMIDREQLTLLVEEWRRLLCPEWRVQLSDSPHPDTDDDEIFAEVQTRTDYTEMVMHVTDRALQRPREELAVSVVHELLHALTRPWRQQIDDAAGQLSVDAARALQARRSHEEEQLVDRLARTIVDLARGPASIPVGPGTVRHSPGRQLFST